jgi:hypothetical protein
LDYKKRFRERRFIIATRTISDLAGNYNSTATWVEGVVPTSADEVVATATSGNLTVNVSSAARNVNLTNYSNTITVNNTWTVSGASQTNRVPSGVLFAGTGTINFSGGTVTLDFSSTSRITNFNISVGNKTITGTIFCVNFLSSGNSITLTGGTIDVSGNLGTQAAASLRQLISAGYLGTTLIKLTGTGNISFTTSLRSPGGIEIDTSGTYSTTSQQLILIGPGSSLTQSFKITNGNIGSFNLRMNASAITNDFFSLDLGGKKLTGLWLANNAVNSGFTTKDISLVGTASFDYIISENTSRTHTTDNGALIWRFLDGSLSASNVYLASSLRTTSAANNTEWNHFALGLRFNSDFTHTIGSFAITGAVVGTKPSISSVTASSTVNINLISKTASQIWNYNFTDVNAVGEQIVAINGTLLRTTNVTNVYPTSGGGGGASSFTFVN